MALVLEDTEQGKASTLSMAPSPAASTSHEAALVPWGPPISMAATPPIALAPPRPLAARILDDFAEMNVGKAKAKAVADKASGKTKLPCKAGAPTKAKANIEGKTKAPATPNEGRKRKTCVWGETTRMTWRVRLGDGSSKGFKYTTETKESARQEAQQYLDANTL